MSKRYTIYATVTGGKLLGEVDADSKEQAIDKAYEELDTYVSLCHHCATECEDAEVTEVTAELAE